MKLAVMQPYLFPYLGYFQLLGAVDHFVVYDDVAFIKRGWINRNRILVGGKPHLFSVPLSDASCFKPIHETEVDRQGYARWLRKFLMTVERSYARAPLYTPVRRLIDAVFEGFEGSIAELARRSIVRTAEYLGLSTAIVATSRGYGNGALKGRDRLIDIARRDGADTYVNAIGGRELYAQEDFAAEGIGLLFLKPRPVRYPQWGEAFVPSLSVIDAMMFNAPARIGELLLEFDLV